MSRFDRPTFNLGDLPTSGEPRTRLQFDWLRDDDDRRTWLKELKGEVHEIWGRAQVQNDPAPPRDQPVKQGHARVFLISDPEHVARALSESENFSNQPYAELGGASFMLAIDPAEPGAPDDWHAEQRQLAKTVLRYARPTLVMAAQTAGKQAALLSLRATRFDMAEWAEQAALRYVGTLFGFSGGDHALLEDVARTGYRALQYLIIGRHFTSEPDTLPAAQKALARLATRSASLMDEYALLNRSKRKPLRPALKHPAETWPDGVQPWSDLGFCDHAGPVLKKLALTDGKLNGQDLCNLVGGLLVGTVGNVQTALCQMVEHLLANPTELRRIKAAKDDAMQTEVEVQRLLTELPPVPFLPRRVGPHPVSLGKTTLHAHADCILALVPQEGKGCPHSWGQAKFASRSAAHDCLGIDFIMPLLVDLLQTTLALPGLTERIDGTTGERLKPERLWGMGCLRYPLRYDREKRRTQQPLIVLMRIRSPQAENAERLRRIVRSGAPRIEWALKESRQVHMAWFEFMENDTVLALRTVYDGNFDAYILHFALKVGELFDQIFDCIEGAPPLPVSEYPNEFVETIRRFNREPLGGYFFSAYPDRETSQINRGCKK